LESAVTYQHYIREEISSNFCHLLHNIFFPSPIKNLEIEVYKTTVMYLFMVYLTTLSADETVWRGMRG
jgi:hypothetical protein